MSNDNYIQNSINIQDFNLKIKSTDTIFINGNKTFFCIVNSIIPNLSLVLNAVLLLIK